MTTTIENMSTEQAEAFAGRIFESVIGMLDGWSIYVGDKLGLYEALAARPLTRDQLVSETSTHWNATPNPGE